MGKKNTKLVVPMSMPIPSSAWKKTKTKSKNSSNRKENDVMKPSTVQSKSKKGPGRKKDRKEVSTNKSSPIRESSDPTPKNNKIKNSVRLDETKDLKVVTATTTIPLKKANIQMSEQVEENITSSSIVADRNQGNLTPSGDANNNDNDDDEPLSPNSSSGSNEGLEELRRQIYMCKKANL